MNRHSSSFIRCGSRCFCFVSLSVHPAQQFYAFRLFDWIRSYCSLIVGGRNQPIVGIMNIFLLENQELITVPNP
jgi:hypothetical protein